MIKQTIFSRHGKSEGKISLIRESHLIIVSLTSMIRYAESRRISRVMKLYLSLSFLQCLIKISTKSD